MRERDFVDTHATFLANFSFNSEKILLDDDDDDGFVGGLGLTIGKDKQIQIRDSITQVRSHVNTFRRKTNDEETEIRIRTEASSVLVTSKNRH